jgi:hypothetical protein
VNCKCSESLNAKLSFEEWLYSLTVLISKIFMSHKKSLLKFIFPSILLLVACTKEEEEKISVIDQCQEKYRGKIELTSNVADYIPYEGISILYFEDSIGSLVKFKTDSGITKDTLRLGFDLSCDTDSSKDQTNTYTQERQDISFSLDSNDAFSERAVIFTSMQAQLTRSGSIIEYNELGAGAFLSQEPYTDYWLSGVFTFPDINSHPFLSNNYNNPVPSLEINGKTYSNVFVAEALGLGYTFDRGIVFFRDGEGQFWTLKSMK